MANFLHMLLFFLTCIKRNPLYDTLNVNGVGGVGTATELYHTIANPTAISLSSEPPELSQLEQNANPPAISLSSEPPKLSQLEQNGNIQSTNVEMEDKL